MDIFSWPTTVIRALVRWLERQTYVTRLRANRIGCTVEFQCHHTRGRVLPSELTKSGNVIARPMLARVCWSFRCHFGFSFCLSNKLESCGAVSTGPFSWGLRKSPLHALAHVADSISFRWPCKLIVNLSFAKYLAPKLSYPIISHPPPPQVPNTRRHTPWGPHSYSLSGPSLRTLPMKHPFFKGPRPSICLVVVEL